ncbi:MAG: alpha/beta hydrolase [Myxococcota bacterium]
MKALFGGLLGVLLVLGLGLASLFVLQRRLIYFPDPSVPGLPSVDREAGLKEVFFDSGDGVQLRAWHNPALPGAATVLILHGNGGHRGGRLDLIRHLLGLQLGVFALDYRGYGGSAGTPSESGLYTDAKAAVDWLESRGFDRLVYFGESLGTGVAVELALRRPPSKLVLQAPFDSLAAVGARAYPFLPVDWILRDRFASLEKIDRVEASLLILHGVDDRIVPIAHGRRLFDQAREPKRFIAIEGAGHNDLRLVGDRFFNPLDDFLVP